jgi:Domain of unknown function (DUF4326)
MCIVVHCKKEPYDIYCGRPSKWGNPYSHKEGTLAEFKVDTRDEAVDAYESYLLSNKELMDSLPELMYKKISCWCFPKKCHCDILKKYVDRLEDADKRKKLLAD